MPYWTKPSVRLRELCQKEVACRMRVVEKSTGAQAQIFAESCIHVLQKAAACQRELFAAWLKGTGGSPIKQKAAFVSLQVQPFLHFQLSSFFCITCFDRHMDSCMSWLALGFTTLFTFHFRAL